MLAYPACDPVRARRALSRKSRCCFKTCAKGTVRCILHEIIEDICPQREGYDEDCERRCREYFPIVIGSGCQVRNTGALLSLFGIRSFQCKCLLPMEFCVPGADPMRMSFSLPALRIHSNVVKLKHSGNSCNQKASLSCDDQFDGVSCGWQRSAGADWFESTAKPGMSFSPAGRPTATYLTIVGRQGVSNVTLSTCGRLCSTDSVAISARIWRAPWVKAEMCFREPDSVVFCQYLTGVNGELINETLPQTENFQIFFKFSNISDGDVVMLDDIRAKFTSCPQPVLVEHTAESPLRRSGDTNDLEINRISGPKRVLSANTHRIHRNHGDTETLRRRLCKDGECTTILHQPVSVDEEELKCAGRIGLLRCRSKCKSVGDDGSSARCIRQKEFPFTKRCICQPRRSPKVSAGRIRLPFAETATATTSVLATSTQLINVDNEVEKNEVSSEWKDDPRQKAETMMCGFDGDSSQCDSHCRQQNPKSSGICVPGALPKCECSVCNTLICDFDSSDCGWTDLRLLSAQFNNISVAAKRDKVNRYGLSQMRPASYSGLLRRGQVTGPIALSVDVYPSESIDVRICVDSLYKCQSQTVSARSWNRVSAKIKVSQTDKIFLLFYNNDRNQAKTIALDNISLKGGPCNELTKH